MKSPKWLWDSLIFQFFRIMTCESTHPLGTRTSKLTSYGDWKQKQFNRVFRDSSGRGDSHLPPVPCCILCMGKVPRTGCQVKLRIPSCRTAPQSSQIGYPAGTISEFSLGTPPFYLSQLLWGGGVKPVHFMIMSALPHCHCHKICSPAEGDIAWDTLVMNKAGILSVHKW